MCSTRRACIDRWDCPGRRAHPCHETNPARRACLCRLACLGRQARPIRRTCSSSLVRPDCPGSLGRRASSGL